MISKVVRIMAVMALVLLILVLGLLAAGAIAKANLAKQYPAPGQLVDVGGYKMHIHCTGQGSPTVILEAGSSEFTLNWAMVQPGVTAFTRVCSYDRAGFGWSDPSPRPRTVNAMVEELHTLLANARVAGPYVLVGHSIGGLLVRVYAHTYPEEVVGMALVDSPHDEQDIRLSTAVPKYTDWRARIVGQATGQFRTLGLLSSTGLMAFAQQSIPDPGFPENALAQYRATLATGRFFETALAEMNAQEKMLADARKMHIGSFGNMPLVVLSAGQWEADPAFSEVENNTIREATQVMQSELAALSSAGKQIIADQSGHMIQLEQPDLVVGIIREMVNAIGKTQAGPAGD